MEDYFPSKAFQPSDEHLQFMYSGKFNLIFKPELGSLNKREEIKNQCRHKEGLLLDNT
jgi:hypothetical protein